MKKLLFPFLCLLFCSCRDKPKIKVDLIVHHARVYTVDGKFRTLESFAVKDGKILACGTSDSILNTYQSSHELDAKGKPVYPGFIDAHCHFYGYGRNLLQIDLTGAASFDEVILRLRDFVKLHPASLNQDKNFNTKWILARGWDQNRWTNKEFPDRRKLDSLFPDRPVFLTRVDGHAALVNGEALRLAGIKEWKNVEGGYIGHRIKDIKNKEIGHIAFNQLSGLLVDNAVGLVESIIPAPSVSEMRTALLRAQRNCFAVGLTTVDDAGLDKKRVDEIDSLQKSGALQMRIYAMLSDNKENLAWYLEKGMYKTERLNVRSFKFYADGALGSRGACLLKPYTDKPGEQGFLLHPQEYYSKMALKMFEKGFQMNTHCIGDSAVRMILHIYDNLFREYIRKGGHLHFDPRWRIEHFQITTPEDIALLSFSGNKPPPFIASVQPTHATSDMYWAEERLGPERLPYAYAYNDLLKATGMIALGTDFPVEDISPIKTFYAAVARMDDKGWPTGGFQPQNALSREDALRGMTIWAAYANFEEKEKGSIEPGKFADFVILNDDIMKEDMKVAKSTTVIATYINGVKVY